MFYEETYLKPSRNTLKYNDALIRDLKDSAPN